MVFLLWLRRRYANLATLRHHTTYQPGWAIGSFFVPFLNFVRPFQIVRETLKYSTRRPSVLAPLDNALLYSWWVLFWTDNILGQVVFRMAPKDGALIDAYVSYSWMVAASDLVECVLFPLYLLLILQVGSRQEQSFKEISEPAPETDDDQRPALQDDTGHPS